MPKEEIQKAEVYIFGSPLDTGNSAAEPVLNSFLERFQEGIPDTEEGRRLVDRVADDAIGMVRPLDVLFRQGMFDGLDAFPSVDDVVSQGRQIHIVEPDGAITNYSDKFLKDNPTVARLREMEKQRQEEARGSRPPYGRVLLTHLSAFLGGQGQKKLNDFDKVFGGLSPADPASQSKVFIELPDGRMLSLIDKTSEKVLQEDERLQKAEADQRQKLQEDLNRKAEASIAKQQEIEKARQRYERLPHPEIPPFPVERNVFRRFFTWIHLAPHSAAYNAELEKYNEVKRTRAPYDARKKAFDEMIKVEQPVLDRLEEELLSAQKKLNDQIKMDEQAMANRRQTPEYQAAEKKRDELETVTDLFRKEKQEIKDKILDATTNAEAVREKILAPGAVAKINLSDAVQFSKGSVSTILNIIRNREAIDKEMKEDPVEADNKTKEILKIAAKRGIRIDNVVRIDNTPYADVNEFVTLTDYKNASKYAFTAESQGAQAEEEDRQKGKESADYQAEKQYVFNKLAKNNYNRKVESSKQCFEEIFGLKPNVENVQAVIKTVNLDGYVKQGITQIDGVKYDPVEHKLPKVNETNLGDMTMLLMSGIKTLSLGPQAAPEANRKEAEQEKSAGTSIPML